MRLPAATAVVAAVVAATVLSAAIAALAWAADPPEGLELHLKLATKGPIQPGERIHCAAALVNRSKTATHRVVRANDGSESGWREPHVFWTATFVSADGVERPVEAQPPGRCGMFSVEWWRDVRDLAPRASMAIESMTAPHLLFDVQEDGKLRLVAHYAWNAGKNARGDPMSGPANAPENLGGMKGVAPYELTSNAAEIEIRRAFEVVARAKGSFKAGIAAPLSRAVEVSVRSRSETPLTFVPGEWQVTLRNDDRALPWPDHEIVAPREWGAAFDLAPAGATPLVGGGPLGKGRDVTVRFGAAGRARIAVAIQRVSGEGPNLTSNWIEVDVEK